jgi:hypothetical protein
MTNGGSSAVGAEAGALQPWLETPPTPGPATEDRWWPGMGKFGAPRDAPPTGAATSGGPPRPALSAPAESELADIRAELELTRARAALLRDPAWLDELSPAERAQERSAAEAIRAMRREQALRAATATEKLGGREQRVTARLAAIELSDRMWSRRAQARRMRLLDPSSRLASLQRTHIASSAALICVAVAGIAWTAMGVHDALVGPDGNPLAYVVEPIFSVPLLVIMGLSARAVRRHLPPARAAGPGLRGRGVPADRDHRDEHGRGAARGRDLDQRRDPARAPGPAGADRHRGHAAAAGRGIPRRDPPRRRPAQLRRGRQRGRG